MVIRLPSRMEGEGRRAAMKRKRVIEEVDLCNSDDESAPAVASTNQSNKRPRTDEQAATPSPSQNIPRSSPKTSTEAAIVEPTPPSSQNTAQSSPQPSAEVTTAIAPTPLSSQDTLRLSPQASREVTTTATQLPTPQATPQKPKELYEQAQLADRYVAKRSTLEGVEYTNPQKFSLRPPFQIRLNGEEVAKIIAQLRAQIDPIPISKALDRPVEEVKHMIDALVVNPLYDHQEAVQRNEDSMAALMRLVNPDDDTLNRKWGEPNEAGKYYAGEVSGIEMSSVQVTGSKTGAVRLYKLSDLSVEDKKYLNLTLTADQMEKLWKESGCRKWGPVVVKDATTGEIKKKPVTGKFHSVEAGVVKITGRDSGRIFDVKLEELSQEDKDYLNVELLAEAKMKLLEGDRDFFAESYEVPAEE